jgi:hypothetical protein
VPAGALSLWKGIAPALLRQFLYTGLRMGIYEPIRNFFAFGGTKASDATLITKIMAGTSHARPTSTELPSWCASALRACVYA